MALVDRATWLLRRLADGAEDVACRLEDWAEGAAMSAIGLIREALHLRMYGENAPGGNETWAEWDRKAEAFLRELDLQVNEARRGLAKIQQELP
jgi:hypothetical protein